MSFLRCSCVLRPAWPLLVRCQRVVAVSGCGFTGLYGAPLPGGADLGDHPYKVTIYFANVLDLVPQSMVKVNDVPVGRVDKVELEQGRRRLRRQEPQRLDGQGQDLGQRRRPAAVERARAGPDHLAARREVRRAAAAGRPARVHRADGRVADPDHAHRQRARGRGRPRRAVVAAQRRRSGADPDDHERAEQGTRRQRGGRPRPARSAQHLRRDAQRPEGPDLHRAGQRRPADQDAQREQEDHRGDARHHAAGAVDPAVRALEVHDAADQPVQPRLASRPG